MSNPNQQVSTRILQAISILVSKRLSKTLQISGEILRKLRTLMRDPRVPRVGPGLDAYIVPSGDAHHSEYLADTDKRRAFVCGFDGSAGTAVVTMEGPSRMWTDGR